MKRLARTDNMMRLIQKTARSLEISNGGGMNGLRKWRASRMIFASPTPNSRPLEPTQNAQRFLD